MTNKITSVVGLTVRCSNCKRVEDECGNSLTISKKEQDVMDSMEAIFTKRGWQMGAHCPNCLVS